MQNPDFRIPENWLETPFFIIPRDVAPNNHQDGRKEASESILEWIFMNLA